MKNKSLSIVGIAFLFSVLVPFVGYLSFGIWPALLFLTGYMGGFLLWLFFPTRAPFKSIKWIYIATFLLFLVHRVEEKVSGFFATLADMTGVPIPEIVSVPIILLLLFSVLGWLIGPILYKRNISFGYYLVWTFFASMGITELPPFPHLVVMKSSTPRWLRKLRRSFRVLVGSGFSCSLALSSFDNTNLGKGSSGIFTGFREKVARFWYRLILF